MRRGGVGGGSNSPACAACKHQRRKCAATCPLAPHFPPTRRSDFLNAHRLFGVSNILKTLNDVADPSLRPHAVRSIVFHANARAADPVGGCFRIISNLRRQIERTHAELSLVRRHLSAAASAHAPPLGVLEPWSPALGKQGPLVDVSEDIKPFLHMFDENKHSDSIDGFHGN